MVAAVPPLAWLWRRGTESGLQANSSAPGGLNPCFADRLVEFAQRGFKLLPAALGQVGFLLVEQTVGEGVLAGGVRGYGLLDQMFPADHAVLMIA